MSERTPSTKTPPSSTPHSPLDTANLDADLNTLDDILSGPAPSGDPCPHCGGPDCPGGDDDPCVVMWRDEFAEVYAEDTRWPANDDGEGEP